MSGEPDSKSAADAYAAFVEAELNGQEARKTSLEDRGSAVITSSGAIVTLLFGLVALVTGVEKYELPSAARDRLALAVALFVIAILLALLTNLPLAYKSVSARDLRAEVNERWTDAEEEALKAIALTRVTIIERAKTMNTAKAWVVVTAMTVEGIAVLIVAMAVASILAA